MEQLEAALAACDTALGAAMDAMNDPRLASGGSSLPHPGSGIPSGEGWSGARARALLTRVERLGRRTDALRLRLVDAADRAGVPERGGFTDAGSWTSRHTHRDRRPAASDASLAAALGQGGPPTDDTAGTTPAEAAELDAGTTDEPETPGRTLTGQALDAGDISVAHARVITRALDDLPASVDATGRATCESELLRAARTVTPARLRHVARRVLQHVEGDRAAVDAHEDAVLTREEDAAHDRAELWIKDNHDGTMTGHFTVPALAGAQLRTVIDAMTAPRRRTGSAGSTPGMSCDEGPGDVGWKQRQLDWQHRRGLALTELLGHLPTDHLHDKATATVLVTLDLATLTGERTGAATTDTDHPVSAGQARRTACEAGIIPTVLDGDSLPLDLGRQRRLFSPAQRAALATRYRTCAADGCERPFAWSEIHHLQPWHADGRTDLDNAVPLCGTHHRWIDRTDMRHRVHRHPDGRASITFGDEPERPAAPPG